MDGIKSVPVPAGELRLCPNGVVSMSIREGWELTSEDVRALVQAKEQHVDGKAPLLIDMRSSYFATYGAMREIANCVCGHATGVAYLCRSLVGLQVAEYVIGLMPGGVAAAAFLSERAAVTWLERTHQEVVVQQP